MPREDTQFKKGNQLGKVNGGRPKKPEWLKGKGEEALKKAYEIMLSDTARPELQLQAARMIAEYDLGKPQQTLDVNADIVADAQVSMIETMSLSKRGTAMKKALEAYEKNNQAQAK